MTKIIIFSAIGIMAILAVLLPFMPLASADDTTCIGTLASGTYDNVIVPAGFFCEFASGVTVNGNVNVESNAFLLSFDANTVNGDVNVASGASVHFHSLTLGGNVEGSNCDLIFIDDSDTTIGNVKSDGCSRVDIVISSIGGDVLIENTSTVSIRSSSIGGDVQEKNSGFTQVSSNTIGGNLQIEDNTGFRVGVWSNTVAGDLQYNGNTSTGGSFPSIVGRNTVGGNLQCSGNTPAAAPFGFNTVTGDKEGECASL